MNTFGQEGRCRDNNSHQKRIRKFASLEEETDNNDELKILCNLNVQFPKVLKQEIH